ncbi:MAG: peptidylprolyl isomerase [Thermodesulfobacteriota bacterium]|jgi:peptidyl-prolyl cis-trans isomerase SurA
MKKKINSFLVILVLGIGGGLAHAQEVNRIVAIVNNEIITFHELEKALRNYRPSVMEKVEQEEFQKQVLFHLIDQKLVDMQIKRLGVQIPSDEVDKAVARIKQEQGVNNPEDFSAALLKEGLSEAEFRNKIKEQILRFRLISREIGSKIVIPEVRIQEYYQKNKYKLQKTEGVHLAHILLTISEKSSPDEIERQKKKGEELLGRLKKGEDFAELARKFSQDPSATQGGDLGMFVLEEIEPALQKVISVLKPGEFSSVIQSPNGWQIIKLIDIKGAKEVSFDEVRGRIQEQLFQEEVDQRFAQWLQKIKDRSYIKVLL